MASFYSLMQSRILNIKHFVCSYIHFLSVLVSHLFNTVRIDCFLIIISLYLQFEAKICLVTSFRDTSYIEILPKDKNPARGMRRLNTICCTMPYLFLLLFLLSVTHN